MDYSLISSPVLGGVIGYFTNWLAIKMLFLPRSEIYLWGKRLPFTPGVLPKSRLRFAKNIGDTVGNYLLTDETLKDAIINSNIDESLSTFMDEMYDKFCLDDKTVGHYLQTILKQDYDAMLLRAEESTYKLLKSNIQNDIFVNRLSEEIVTLIGDYLSDNTCDMIVDNMSEGVKSCLVLNRDVIFNKDNISNVIDSAVKDIYTVSKAGKVRLRDFLSETSINEIKDALAVYTPKLSAMLAQLINENETLNEGLRQLTRKVVEDSVGSLIGGMVYQRVYKSIKENALEYLSEPDNMVVFTDKIMEKLDGLFEMEISKLEEKFFEHENTVNDIKNRLIDYIMTNDGLFLENINALPEKVLSGLRDKTMYEAVVSFVPGFEEKLLRLTEGILKSLMDNHMERLYKSLFLRLKENLLNIKISTIANKAGRETYEKLKSWILAHKNDCIESASAAISQKIDIKKIVETKINELDIIQMESIVLDVANRELNYITYMGGVLGFIIGLVPVVLELL